MIELITGERGELNGLSEAGIKRTKDEMIPLSEMIDVLNERFGTEFEEADRLFFEQIEARCTVCQARPHMPTHLFRYHSPPARLVADCRIVIGKTWQNHP